MLPFAPHSLLPGPLLRGRTASATSALFSRQRDVGLRVRVESGGFFTPVSRTHRGLTPAWVDEPGTPGYGITDGRAGRRPPSPVTAGPRRTGCPPAAAAHG